MRPPRSEQRPPWFLTDAEQQAVYDAFAVLGPRLNELRNLSAESESYIEGSGVRFNAELQHLEEATRKRGRPRRIANTEIVNTYEAIREEYKEKTGEDNSQEVREAIRRALSHMIPPDLLGAERKGPIWSAIDNRLGKPYR